MAFVLRDRETPDATWYAIAFLGLITLMFAFPISQWAYTGCFTLKRQLVCGPPATAFAAIFSGFVVSMWFSFLWPTRPKWGPYDPTWLVALAEAELPEDAKLREALSACRKVAKTRWRSKTAYFVDRRRDWHLKEAIVFETYEKGPVIIDVLEDGRIGSVECTWLVGFRAPRGW